jgi:hypothetical protein
MQGGTSRAPSRPEPAKMRREQLLLGTTRLQHRLRTTRPRKAIPLGAAIQRRGGLLILAFVPAQELRDLSGSLVQRLWHYPESPLVATSLNTELLAVPSAAIAVKHAMTIKPNMIAYSTAVGPSCEARNLRDFRVSDFIAIPPFQTAPLLGTSRKPEQIKVFVRQHEQRRAPTQAYAALAARQIRGGHASVAAVSNRPIAAQASLQDAHVGLKLDAIFFHGTSNGFRCDTNGTAPYRQNPNEGDLKAYRPRRRHALDWRVTDYPQLMPPRPKPHRRDRKSNGCRPWCTDADRPRRTRPPRRACHARTKPGRLARRKHPRASNEGTTSLFRRLAVPEEFRARRAKWACGLNGRSGECCGLFEPRRPCRRRGFLSQTGSGLANVLCRSLRFQHGVMNVGQRRDIHDSGISNFVGIIRPGDDKPEAVVSPIEVGVLPIVQPLCDAKELIDEFFQSLPGLAFRLPRLNQSIGSHAHGRILRCWLCQSEAPSAGRFVRAAKKTYCGERGGGRSILRVCCPRATRAACRRRIDWRNPHRRFPGRCRWAERFAPIWSGAVPRRLPRAASAWADLPESALWLE